MAEELLPALVPTADHLAEATLTDARWEKGVASAPGHIVRVRRLVFDAHGGAVAPRHGLPYHPLELSPRPEPGQPVDSGAVGVASGA